MNKSIVIATREFLSTISTKGFVVGTFVFPLMVTLVLPNLASKLQKPAAPLYGKLIVSGIKSDALVSFREAFSEHGRDVTPILNRKTSGRALLGGNTTSPSGTNSSDIGEPIGISLEAAEDGVPSRYYKDKIRDGELLMYLETSKEFSTMQGQTDSDRGTSPLGIAGMYFSERLSPEHITLIRGRVTEALKRTRLRQAGYDTNGLKAAMEDPVINSVTIDSNGNERKDNSRIRSFLPFFFIGIIVYAVMSSGQRILNATLEDKNSKVLEVMLSSVTPLQLLIGRIAAQGLVTVVVFTMYGIMGVGGLAALGALDVSEIRYWLVIALFLPVAYLYSAAAMAALGGAATTSQQAQPLMMPAILVLVFVPLLLARPIASDPNGTLALALSFVPPWLPFVVVIRSVVVAVPLWQLLVSIVVGYSSVFVSLYAAARIFRLAILTQNSTLSWGVIASWLRKE